MFNSVRWILLMGFGMCCLVARGQVNKASGQLQGLDGWFTCSINTYEGTRLVKSETVSFSDKRQQLPGWEVSVQVQAVPREPDAADVAVRFKRTTGMVKSTAVSADLSFGNWSRTNYVMVPASVYNGNRYHAIGQTYNPPYPKEMYYNPRVPLTISNNPRLSIDTGKASLIALQTGNAATPAMCVYSAAAGKGFLVMTDQRSKWGNHGLTIAENAAQDSCRF